MGIAFQIQAFQRASAALRWAAQALPPFTLFIGEEGAPGESFAIPDVPLGGDLRADLVRLRAAFDGQGRPAALQWVEGFAPALAPALSAAGWHQVSRAPLLACTAATYRPAPLVAGLSFVELSAESALGEVQENLDANALGFDPQAALATPEQAAAFRVGLVESRAFTARLDGQPVGAGMFLPPSGGVSELAGIATLLTFRRRGVAAALTGRIVEAALARGIDTLVLTTDSPEARRVYERVGFFPASELLTWSP